MRHLSNKENELLINAYRSHLKFTESPLTPQNLGLLKFLLKQGLIEPVRHSAAGKNFIRFGITKKGIKYVINSTDPDL